MYHVSPLYRVCGWYLFIELHTRVDTQQNQTMNKRGETRESPLNTVPSRVCFAQVSADSESQQSSASCITPNHTVAVVVARWLPGKMKRFRACSEVRAGKEAGTYSEWWKSLKYFNFVIALFTKKVFRHTAVPKIHYLNTQRYIVL